MDVLTDLDGGVRISVFKAGLRIARMVERIDPRISRRHGGVDGVHPLRNSL